MAKKDLNEAEKALYPAGLIDIYRRLRAWPPRCDCGALGAFTDLDEARCLCLACLRGKIGDAAKLEPTDDLAAARATLEADSKLASSFLSLAYPAVEVADATIDSMTGGSVTITAHKTVSGWRYTVLNTSIGEESTDQFPESNELPDAKEVIDMIDDACSGDEGLYVARQWAFDEGEEPEEAAHLIQVTSSLHPEVDAHFHKEACLLAEEWAELRGEDEDEDEDEDESDDDESELKEE